MSARRGRVLPRGGFLLIAVAVIVLYRTKLPSWVWTLAVGIVVVAAVYYWLGLLRRRR